MRFQVYSGAIFIGSSDLENLDPPMGIASGGFLPSEDYRMVQPVFRLYAEAAVNEGGQASGMFDQYYRERDSLDLTVRLSSGEVIPMQCVHIEDFSVELGEMQITVAVPNRQTFIQYFESSGDVI